ncbi:MAG: DUF1415 domain-containing protein [Lewinellaceae bacterium]|nr:DUF1415 domain-containing protein [Lewinellaceae bacterium]
MTETTIIAQTTNWIKSVVIGCNFCPFAAKALLKKGIRFVVSPESSVAKSMENLADEFRFLDNNPETETTLLIFPDNFSDFNEYLDLVDLAEALLDDLGYEGIYQVASFHPEYVFAGAEDDDPANYTNRSIYPMLHIIREDSITAALENYPGAENIPEHNIAFAQQKGLLYMQMLRAACIEG